MQQSRAHNSYIHKLDNNYKIRNINIEALSACVSKTPMTLINPRVYDSCIAGLECGLDHWN